MAQLDPSQYRQLSRTTVYGASYGLYYDQTNSLLVLAINDSIVMSVSAAGAILAGALEAPDLSITGQARGDLLRRGASAWERLAAKTTGRVIAGDGTDVVSAPLTGDVTAALTAGNLVTTIGAAKVLSTMLEAGLTKRVTGSISAADIIATGAGKLGHAEGYPLLAPVGAHNAPEFVSCAIFCDYSTAAYTDGGNLTVNLSGGGAAQSDPVSAANSLGAAADKAVVLRPPTATAGVALVENAGLNLVAAAAFTDPGTAAGVLRYALNYRVHATGL
jgi:hypothetical protein